MSCVRKKCSGSVDVKKGFSVRTGYRSSDVAYSCSECGRLHFLQGDEFVGVCHRGGAEVFLVEGELVNRKPESPE